MKKVGVLVPQSKSYPGIGRDFINGLKLQASEEVGYFVEGIGIGDDVRVTCDKIDKLVLQEDVDVIIALIGDKGLITAYEKVNELQIPTLFARMGAFPDLNMEGNKYAFTLSYGLCDSLGFLGDWFPKNGYNHIGVSGSFNDVGYGFLAALENSLYKAGGEFSGHYTPPLNPRPDEAQFLAEFYQNVKSDAVCQLYNGVFAEENIQYLESIEGGVKTPLFFSPFGLNEDLFPKIGALSDDVYMFASWLPVSMTGEPTDFENAYYEKFDVYPSVAAMLGFNAMQEAFTLISKRKQLLAGETLEQSESNVMVGKWGADLRFKTTFKIWKMSKSQDKIKMIELASSDEAKEYNDPFEGQEKGWHNAYLCY